MIGSERCTSGCVVLIALPLTSILNITQYTYRPGARGGQPN